MAWLAELRTEEESAHGREAARRQLRLQASAIAGPTSARVLIHNISSTGLLFESSEDMPIAEVIEVDLPETGMTAARVIWRSDNFYGCQFEAPVASKVMSAAQLRSPPEPRVADVAASLPEVFQIAEPSPYAAAATRPGELSARSKVAIIFGISVALWAAILLPVLQLA